ncbi:MAG: AbiV family abortive infection protein [Tenacibaculum sp.]|nr:AbiV family abortive infection protein [Tenacibaculum sp.]
MKEKILKAIYDTYNHSKELFDDADFLLQAGKKERAYTFFHFSFEESGRFFILLKVLFEYLQGNIEAKNLNYKYIKTNGYENHIKKLEEATLKMMIIPVWNAIMNGDKEAEKFILNFYKSLKSNIDKYNDNKNHSIYLSYINNDFKLPKDLITDDDLHEIKELAEIQIINLEKLFKWEAFPKPMRT